MIDILIGKVRFRSAEECQEKLNEIAVWISKAELKGGEKMILKELLKVSDSVCVEIKVSNDADDFTQEVTGYAETLRAVLSDSTLSRKVSDIDISDDRKLVVWLER